MTPLQIEMLLHIYARAYPPPNLDCGAQSEVMEGFWREELIQGAPEPKRYELTERGQFYVNALMALPLPVAQWHMPSPTNIEMEHQSGR